MGNESEIEIINILKRNLSFISEMIEKLKGSKYEAKWRKMHDMISEERITPEQAKKLHETIKGLKNKVKETTSENFEKHKPKTVVKQEMLTQDSSSVPEPGPSSSSQPSQVNPEACLNYKVKVERSRSPQNDVETEKEESSDESSEESPQKSSSSSVKVIRMKPSDVPKQIQSAKVTHPGSKNSDSEAASSKSSKEAPSKSSKEAPSKSQNSSRTDRTETKIDKTAMVPSVSSPSTKKLGETSKKTQNLSKTTKAGPERGNNVITPLVSSPSTQNSEESSKKTQDTSKIKPGPRSSKKSFTQKLGENSKKMEDSPKIAKPGPKVATTPSVSSPSTQKSTENAKKAEDSSKIAKPGPIISKTPSTPLLPSPATPKTSKPASKIAQNQISPQPSTSKPQESSESSESKDLPKTQSQELMVEVPSPKKKVLKKRVKKISPIISESSDDDELPLKQKIKKMSESSSTDANLESSKLLEVLRKVAKGETTQLQNVQSAFEDFMGKEGFSRLKSLLVSSSSETSPTLTIRRSRIGRIVSDDSEDSLQPKRKRQKCTEVDRLNAAIEDSFIRDEVRNAQGRLRQHKRGTYVFNSESSDNEDDALPSPVEEFLAEQVGSPSQENAGSLKEPEEISKKIEKKKAEPRKMPQRRKTIALDDLRSRSSSNASKTPQSSASLSTDSEKKTDGDSPDSLASLPVMRECSVRLEKIDIEGLRMPVILLPNDEIVRIKCEEFENSAVAESSSESIINSPNISRAPSETKGSEETLKKSSESLRKSVEASGPSGILSKSTATPKISVETVRKFTETARKSTESSKTSDTARKSTATPKSYANLRRLSIVSINSSQPPKSSETPRKPTETQEPLETPKKASNLSRNSSEEAQIIEIPDSPVSNSQNPDTSADIKPILLMPLLPTSVVPDDMEIITIDDDDDDDVVMISDKQTAEKPTGLQTPVPASPVKVSKVFEKAWNFVDTLCFWTCRTGVNFKCNSELCFYEESNAQLFEYHIQTKHVFVKWSGYCKLCKESVSNFGSLLSEYKHMVDVHIKSDATAEPTSVNQQNPQKNPEKVLQPLANPPENNLIQSQELQRFIPTHPPPTAQLKIRQLPGDKLSGNKTITLPISGPNEGSSPVQRVAPQPASPSPVIQIYSLPRIETTKLRPWLEVTDSKQFHSIENMLKLETLKLIFKCMASNCDFGTNDPEVFGKHILYHRLKHSQDSANFSKCCYCKFSAQTAPNLVQHVMESHKYDRYGCSKCFYKSIERHNIIGHIAQYHPEAQATIIEWYACPLIDRRIAAEEARGSRNLYINPISCVCCKAKFFAYKPFVEHYNKEHRESTLRHRCSKCRKETTVRDFSDHLTNCHNIKNYHCVFCSFGSMVLEDIKKHLMNFHPTKLSFLCERAVSENDPSNNVESLQLRYLATAPVARQHNST